jgi:small subunit ribosomal protein S9
MAEDEKKDIETSAEGSEAEAAGPVADEGSSPAASSREEEAPPSAPPAADTSEEQPQDEVAEEDQDDAPEEPAEAPAAEQKPEEPKAEQKKKDAIPGADLEPIAVELEERPLSAEEQARREAEEEERRQREAALVGEAEEEEEQQAASRAPAKLEGDSRFLATGKRKQSIARVTLLPGSGKFEINRRPLAEFFPRPLHQTMAKQPLATTGYEGTVDVLVRVHGGGVSGQAGAVRHGIARALTEIDPELRGELKRRGFLTRDARVKERRKAGLKKARKRPQFSKR